MHMLKSKIIIGLDKDIVKGNFKSIYLSYKNIYYLFVN